MRTAGRLAPAFLLAMVLLPANAQTPNSRYERALLADKPAAYWRLNDSGAATIRNLAPVANAESLNGMVQGKVLLRQPGPRPGAYPDFEPDAAAAAFSGKGDFIRIKDPGANSPVDFDKGDSITLEAWVFPNQIADGQQVCVIGKGRTQNKGVARDNQNYALRLTGAAGTARLNFLFRDARNGTAGAFKSEDLWHRWTSKDGVATGAGWHHIAVTYTFGQGNSLKGYLDGVEVKGAWDMGGKTDLGPVVDNDEVWIASTMGGSSSFNGLIAEVAIHRRALAAQTLKARFSHVPIGPSVAAKDLPKDAVRVELFEGIPTASSWNFTAPDKPVDTWAEPAMAFVQLPQKYSDQGVRVDRGNPFLLRASAAVTLPQGEHRLLLRSLQSARLFVDGKLLGMTRFIVASSGGHEEVPDGPGKSWPAGLRYPRQGHNDQFLVIQSDGQPHVFVLEAFIGGKGLRPETGELSVSVATGTGLFHLLAPRPAIEHTDEGWESFARSQEHRLIAMNTQRRQEAGREEQPYWARRHDLARRLAAGMPAPAVPQVSPDRPAQNDIDRFVNARLQAAGVPAAPLADDYSFLRRVALDTTGLLPTPEQIREFVHDRSADRRARAIDRFLANPSWADHWVSYWQDTLAENPAILKPTLNNTGPFRFWIYESFLDNKPMDRFASELILMRGSVYGGGPAGFGLATQNDVPMADRAQIVSQAFLAMNLACARCHDAPYHDFKQKDLFSLAAMLKESPQEVPTSSSIPANANIKVGRLVNVTLKPGEKVAPAWPFAKAMHDEFAAGVVRKADDTRERLAAFITDARNERFAKVMVNRLWKRCLGWGIVEPVDDWETAKPSHPGLLEWLARELVTHDYDLKHVARLILNSHTYQRQAGLHTPASDKPEDRLFASPLRRRLTAEQVVDSLFAAVGKEMECEMLTLDNDGRHAAKDFLNLGYPKRAWEFTSLSNDRDRPALSMPRTQEIVDLLAMFGWRETRQNPLSARDQSPNVLQPAALASGGMGNGRIARLTDDCAITDLCVQPQPLDRLIEGVFLRVLSRPPTRAEVKLFTASLERGYGERVKPAPPGKPRQKFDRSLLLSWSNHLNAKATEIKMLVEAAARLGDEPTPRLEADWRERMEDALWAMINSPEFVFVP